MWQPLPWLAGGSRVLDLGTIVMLVFVAVIVLLGAGLGFGKRKLPPGIRLVLETGILFIFLGAIVGPHGVGLLTESVVDDLMPVLVVALGWIGFLYGSHLEWRRLRRYPGRSYAVAFGQSIFTLLLTLLVALFALAPLIAMSSEGWMGQASAAMLLASAAAGTAPAMLFLLIGRPRMKRQELSTLQFVATLDDVPGIILLALLFAFCNPHISTSGDLTAGLLAVLGMVVIGVASGFFGPLSAVALPRFFGRLHLGSIAGVQSMVLVLGSSIGPLVMASSDSFTGSYTSGLIACVALPALVLVLNLFARHPRDVPPASA